MNKGQKRHSKRTAAVVLGWWPKNAVDFYNHIKTKAVLPQMINQAESLADYTAVITCVRNKASFSGKYRRGNRPGRPRDSPSDPWLASPCNLAHTRAPF